MSARVWHRRHAGDRPRIERVGRSRARPCETVQIQSPALRGVACACDNWTGTAPGLHDRREAASLTWGAGVAKQRRPIVAILDGAHPDARVWRRPPRSNSPIDRRQLELLSKPITTPLSKSLCPRLVLRIYIPVRPASHIPHTPSSFYSVSSMRRTCLAALAAVVPCVLAQLPPTPSSWPHDYPGMPSGDYSTDWQSCASRLYAHIPTS